MGDKAIRSFEMDTQVFRQEKKELSLMHFYWQSLNHPDGGKTKTSFFSFVLFTFTIFSASFSGFVFSDALVARHLTMAKGEKLSNTWMLPKSNLHFNAEFCWSRLCTFCHSLCTSRTLELCNVHAFMRSSRDKAPWSDKRRTLKRVHDLLNVYSKKNPTFLSQTCELWSGNLFKWVHIV